MFFSISSLPLKAEGFKWNGLFKKVFHKPAASEPKEPLKVEDQKVWEDVINRQSLVEGSRKQKGQFAYDEGVMLYHQFKFDEALRLFEDARIYLPDDEKVIDYIAKCKQLLGVSEGGSGDLVNWMGQQQKIVAQELKVKIKYHVERSENMLAKANELWEKDSFTEAVSLLDESRYEIRRARTSAAQLVTGENRLSSMADIEERIEELDRLQIAWNGVIEKKTIEEAKRKSEDLSRESQVYEMERLDGLLYQARSLYLEGDYRSAEDLSKVILDEWPKNEDAKRLLMASTRKADEKMEKALQKKSEEQWLQNVERIRNAKIPYAKTLNYPKDWRRIEHLRRAKLTVGEEDPEWIKLMEQKLEKRISLHLPDNTLSEVIDMMREQSDVNFVIDSGVDMADARVMELNLSDVRMKAALELILSNISEENPLLYQLRNEAIFITNRENQNLMNRPVSVYYDVTDLVTSFGDGSLGEEAENFLSGEGSTVESLTTEKLIELISSSIEPDSWDQDGVSIALYTKGRIMVVHSDAVHKSISELLEMFRKQQQLQVSIEARFINTDERDLFELGVDWKGIDEMPLTDVKSVGAGVYSDRSQTDYDTRVATEMGDAGADVIGSTTNFLSLDRSVQGLNAQIAVLDPIRASLFFHALSRDESIKTLKAPRLTVMNNRQGTFLQTIEDSYAENFTATNGAVVPQVARASSGTLLVVRPTVSSDRKYITLDLMPRVTSLQSFDKLKLQLPVRQQGGGAGNNNNNSQTEIVEVDVELPQIEKWELQTRVKVPDGGVVMIGGKMENHQGQSIRSVPILGKIPLLGRLFRSEGETDQLGNLVVSVRAKILIFSELERELR